MHLKNAHKGGKMKLYNENATKKPTNLSINSDLLEMARSLHLNLSKEFETYLIELIKKKIQKQWVTENQEAIAEYNKSLEERGIFSDEWRRF